MDLVHFDQGVAASDGVQSLPCGGRDEGLDGLRLLPLFLSVRAAIRAHVLFMKSEQAGGNDAVWQEAKRYFDLAGRLIAPKRAAAGGDRRIVRGQESRCSRAGSRV